MARAALLASPGIAWQPGAFVCEGGVPAMQAKQCHQHSELPGAFSGDPVRPSSVLRALAKDKDRFPYSQSLTCSIRRHMRLRPTRASAQACKISVTRCGVNLALERTTSSTA